MTHSNLSRDVDENRTSEMEDSVLLMLGIGRHFWEQESGDRFVERLLSEDSPAPPSATLSASLAEDLP
jgi:hypothetical protein